jgi:hypothetical protein
VNSKYTVSIKKPDWLPEWEDATQYPDPNTTSPRQWAWEFLRRNPRYQQLWDERIGPHFDPKRWYNDPILEILRNDQYQRQWNELIPAASRSEVFEQQFGIRSFPPPHSMSSADPNFDLLGPRFVIDFLYFRRKPARRHWPRDQPFEINETLSDGDVFIRFNVRSPTEPQLDKAKAILEQQKTYLKEMGDVEPLTSGKVRTDQYRDYLRLLDANTSGALYENASVEVLDEIADKIYVKKRHSKRLEQLRVLNGLKAAILLRDRNYLNMMIPRKNKKKRLLSAAN